MLDEFYLNENVDIYIVLIGMQFSIIVGSFDEFLIFFLVTFYNVQVNFSYIEAGENKQALVKLVACERWLRIPLYLSYCAIYPHLFLLYSWALSGIR